VGEILVFGARDYSMRLWLNPEQIAARSLTASDVVNAIREQNIQVAAGVVGQQPGKENTDFQYTVSTLGRLMEAEQFADIVIKKRGRRPGNPAKGRSPYRTRRQGLQFRAVPGRRASVGLAIFQLPGSNALDTKQAVVRNHGEAEDAIP